MSVKLGVPSKGRLMEKTFEWFSANAGIDPWPVARAQSANMPDLCKVLKT